MEDTTKNIGSDDVAANYTATEEIPLLKEKIRLLEEQLYEAQRSNLSQTSKYSTKYNEQNFCENVNLKPIVAKDEDEGKTMENNATGEISSKKQESKLLQNKQIGTFKPKNYNDIIYKEFKNKEIVNTLPPNPVEFQTYSKRIGTTNEGREYEYLICTLFALKFSTDDNVVDFEMSTNNDKFEDFDDVGLQVTFSDGTLHTFLMQLKHSTNRKNINKHDLLVEKGDFGILKYLKSFKEIEHLGNFSCILFTNRSAGFSRKSDRFELQSQEIAIKPSRSFIAQHLLNTSKTNPSIFQFETAQGRNESDEMQTFFKHFYLFTDQNKATHIRADIRGWLRNDLKCEGEFVTFMQHWWKGNFILTKHDVISKLTELSLAPFIQEISEKSFNYAHSQNSELLKNSIMNFEMTIVKTADTGIAKKIWFETSSTIGQISKASLKYNLTAPGIKHLKELSLEEKSKIMWHLDEAPLVIKFDDKKQEQINAAIKLLERSKKGKKLLLLGNKTKDDFPKWKVLENLLDLHEEKFYSDIIKNFKVSLQGRRSISLEELLDSGLAITEAIETRELFLMSEADLPIGQKLESLPETYIPRTVSTVFLDIEEGLNKYDPKTDLIVLNCDDNFMDTLQHNLNVIQLDDYLTRMRSNITIDRQIIIISTKNKCTKAEFDEICRNTKKSNVYLLQIVDQKRCNLVLSKGDILSLTKIYFKKYIIEEDKIHSIFDSPINVISSLPGMGKSTLMAYLSNNCPPQYWAVYINLIKYNSFFKEEPSYEEILPHFLRDDDPFPNKIKSSFHKNKNIYLFLDGLDEIESSCIEFVLEYVKYVSSSGVHVWVSSRKNFEKVISDKLHVFPIEIHEFDRDQQTKYIRRRLFKNYEEFEIEKIISTIFASVSIIYNSEQFLGVPLQLYIITEIFCNDRENYRELNEESFVLTKMYRMFFEGKAKHQDEKAEVQHKQAYDDDFQFRLRRYEIPALRSCLGNNTFCKLLQDSEDLSDSQNFLQHLKQEGNKLGIISQVIGEDQAIFTHQTYAEYFACAWLKRHKDKLYNIKDEFFNENCQNLRLLFDISLAEERPLHLATIYKSPDQVRKYICNFNEKDEGGRSALHLICSYGKKFKNERYYRSDIAEQMRETSYYKNIFRDLLKCNSIEKDTLFGWNCLDYSMQSKCLFSCHAILENPKKFENLNRSLKSFGEPEVLYCTHLAYHNILALLIERDHSLIHLCSGGQSLLDIVLTSNNSSSVQECYKTIRILVNHGFNINMTDRYNKNALQKTCQNGNPYFTEILIRQGANVNCVTSFGETLLHFAACNQTFTEDTMKLLINEGLDVNAKTKDGLSVLHYACTFGNYKNVKFLLDNGASVNNPNDVKFTMLHCAVKNSPCDENLIKLLLEKGIDIDAKGKNGCSALHWVCVCGLPQTAEILLELGANANVTNDQKQTVLHCAAKNRNFDNNLIGLLLQKGININARDENGYSTLHLTCEFGPYQTVRALLEAGAHLSATTHQNQTMLHCAAKNERFDKNLINLLIDNGISVNAKDDNGYNALHFACEFGPYQTARALIEAGADLNATTYQNQTMLHCAAKNERFDKNLIELLIGNGIDVNARDRDEYSALHLACRFLKCGATLIQRLIDGGSDINAVAKCGYSVLHVTCEHGEYDTIKLLVDRGADVNALTDENSSVLHCILKNKNNNSDRVNSLIGKTTQKQIIKLLIAKGVNIINTINNNNETVLFISYVSKFWWVVDMLLAKNVVLDKTTRSALIRGFSSIFFEGRVKLIKLLLDNVTDMADLTEKLPSNFPKSLITRNGDVRSDLLLEMTCYIYKYRRHQLSCTNSKIISHLQNYFKK